MRESGERIAILPNDREVPKNSIASAVVFPREKVPTELQGPIGIVVQPSSEVITEALRLAKMSVPAESQFMLERPFLPHITLFQSRFFQAVPAEKLIDVVERLLIEVRDTLVRLDTVYCFARGWLFWGVEESSVGRAKLQELHTSALAAGTYVDRSQAVIQADELRALGAPSDLADSMEQYGYSQVGPRFLPHITLGHDPKTLETFQPFRAESEFLIKDIQLCRMGEFGRMESTYTW